MRGGGKANSELFICGNPPYLGYSLQNKDHKDDLKSVLNSLTLYDGTRLNSLDYIAGWLLKAAEYGKYKNVTSAFVATNSICQGISISTLWPLIKKYEQKIQFAYTSFRWSNLASNKAVVTVVIIALTSNYKYKPTIYTTDSNGITAAKIVDNINSYLMSGPVVSVAQNINSISGLSRMERGNGPVDGGNFLISYSEYMLEFSKDPKIKQLVKNFVGSQELVNGRLRKCLWIEDADFDRANGIEFIRNRIESVRTFRQNSKKATTRLFSYKPHRFVEVRHKSCELVIIIPKVSSENRPYLPVGIVDNTYIVSDSAFGIYDDSSLLNVALIASKLHLVWVSTVCGRLGTGFRYSNTLGWNTFPVPKLTSKNKEDLTRAAENILLAREEHFPATIADLYKPDQMPENLRIAHEHNDEIIERIFIGRRFKNDTERLEKLFELYSKMTGQVDNKQKGTNH